MGMASVSDTNLVFRFHTASDSVKLNYTIMSPDDPFVRALVRHPANSAPGATPVVARDPWHCFRPPAEHVPPMSVLRVSSPIIHVPNTAAHARTSAVLTLLKALQMQEFAVRLGVQAPGQGQGQRAARQGK